MATSHTETTVSGRDTRLHRKRARAGVEGKSRPLAIIMPQVFEVAFEPNKVTAKHFCSITPVHNVQRACMAAHSGEKHTSGFCHRAFDWRKKGRFLSYARGCKVGYVSLRKSTQTTGKI